MSRPTATFEDVTVIGATPDALLCVIDGDKVWIPKSQIDDDSDVFDDDEHSTGTLVVTEWIALQKGLL